MSFKSLSLRTPCSTERSMRLSETALQTQIYMTKGYIRKDSAVMLMQMRMIVNFGLKRPVNPFSACLLLTPDLAHPPEDPVQRVPVHKPHA